MRMAGLRFDCSARQNAILWKNPYIRFMKQELPFAVALLAIGCLLLVTQFPFASNAEKAGIQQGFRHKTTAEDATEAGSGEPDEISPPSSFVTAASYQQSLEGEDAPSQTGENPEGLTTSDTPEGDPIASTKSAKTQVSVSSAANSSLIHAHPQAYLPTSVEADEASRVLLQGLIQRIRAGGSFAQPVLLQGKMFDSLVSANGRLVEKGQLSGKFRLELQFNNGFHLLQLSDGRFVYRLQSSQWENEFEFIDVAKIKSRSEQVANQGNRKVSFGLGNGGLAGLLDQFATQFQFSEPEFRADQTVAIHGSWNPVKLSKLLQENEDQKTNSIRWEQIPDQIPHCIEVVIASTVDGVQFVKRISLLKFRVEPEFHTELVMSISLDTPQVMDDSSDALFLIDSQNLETTDRTNQYIARLEEMRKQR